MSADNSGSFQIEVFDTPPKDKYCPYFRSKMAKCCPTCRKWIKFNGQKSDGSFVNGYNCEDYFSLVFTMENGKFANRTNAGVDKLTSAIIKRTSSRLVQHAPADGAYIRAEPVQQLISNGVRPSEAQVSSASGIADHNNSEKVN